ncbi:uncharacterized protein LY79DRAFT_572052 [Colletotrichum navitas]|uniref:Uncharacterized protein n=1 Tax=Colletotrichum navitas TaxID=681940 RepID=A0AAD8PLB0_9PEZI|nr:uncharacterized protein LY79DRAFT_572052 [Colletotrichum navitas]KAK1569352.1 hypothetical protein LY79DRAFT_572052 [Colletotrichum navitas]
MSSRTADSASSVWKSDPLMVVVWFNYYMTGCGAAIRNMSWEEPYHHQSNNHTAPPSHCHTRRWMVSWYSHMVVRE